jgi:hypothetical protein
VTGDLGIAVTIAAFEAITPIVVQDADVIEPARLERRVGWHLGKMNHVIVNDRVAALDLRPALIHGYDLR